MSIEVSVIVCTFNRERYLELCLNALANQTLDNNRYEIVIVNNNSPDNSDSVCKSFISQHPELNISYSVEFNQGHTYARNRGIEEAQGLYFAFIDDDAFVKPPYCEEILNYFENNKEVMALGGRLYPIYDDCEEPKWMNPWLLPLVAALDMGDKPKEFSKRKFPTGANMAFRKSVFDTVGKFNVELGRRGVDNLEGGDEKDMIFRLKSSGGKVHYVPTVEVDHIIPPHRITLDYVRGLATGVGRHERKRLKQEGIGSLVIKWGLEIVKIGGTLMLALYYSSKGQKIKGDILIKFRFWVIRGLLGGY